MVLPLGSLALDEPEIVELSSLTIASVLYQTVWIATVTYVAWFWLVRHYPAPKLASFTFVTPLFGVLAGALILDEPSLSGQPARPLTLFHLRIGIILLRHERTDDVGGNPAPDPFPIGRFRFFTVQGRLDNMGVESDVVLDALGLR